MSVYNTKEKFLRDAIESILCQSFSDFEFIIVDDASTKNIEMIVRSYNDPRIIYLENEKNKGLAFTLNRCLSISRGKYIARMDADDISLPNRLEKQVKYMEATNTDILSTQVRFIGALKGETKGSWDCENIKVNLLFENKPIIHPTVMIRKDFLDKNNLKYNEKYKKAQDYELWSKAIRICSFALLDEVLLLYRVHPNQASTKGKDEQINYADQVRYDLLKELYPNIEIDSESHKQLSLLSSSKNIYELIKWCNTLIKCNAESNTFGVKEFEDNVIYRMLIVYIKSVIQNNRRISFLKETLLTEKILLNIFRPHYILKLGSAFIRKTGF